MVPTAGGAVTLRDWLVHHSEHRDQAWPTVVSTFYERAAADPTIATYFTSTDMPRLQRHFLSALTTMAGDGLRVGTMTRMAGAHVDVLASDGTRITPAVYDAVVGTLVTVLAEHGVPEITREQLGAVAAALRDVIVPAAPTGAVPV